MKKDIQKLALVTLAALVGTLSKAAFAESTHSHTNTAIQQGTAVLPVEDLKVLLGLHDRIPSSGEGLEAAKSSLSQDAEVGNYKLPLKLDAHTRKLLTSKLSQSEMQRSKETAVAEKALEVKTAELRQQRQALQIERTQKDSVTVQRKLLDSILAESNLKARHQNEMGQLAQKNAVTIHYTDMNGERVIHSIEMAGTTLWSHTNKATQMAKQ